MAVIVVVVLAAVVGYFAYRATADLPGVKMPDQGNVHLRTAADPHDPYNSDPPTSGPHFVLAPATVSVIGHEHEWPALLRWNSPP